MLFPIVKRELKEITLKKTTCRSIISIMVRVFANGPEDLGSTPGRVIPKTQKMVLPCLTLSIIR